MAVLEPYSYLEELADEAEQAAVRGETSVVYKINKRICGKNTNQYALSNKRMPLL